MSLPPRRVVETYAAYDVINKLDRTLRFRVITESERDAKVEALDKIGYKLVPRTISAVDDTYVLLDADDLDDIQMRITANNIDAAFNIAFEALGWEINEPEMSVGGVVGGVGFAGTDD